MLHDELYEVPVFELCYDTTNQTGDTTSALSPYIPKIWAHGEPGDPEGKHGRDQLGPP